MGGLTMGGLPYQNQMESSNLTEAYVQPKQSTVLDDTSLAMNTNTNLNYLNYLL